jgi:polyhydroxybutyrate depolymerase
MLKTAIFIAFWLYCFSAQSQIISDSIQIDGHYRTFHYKQPAPSGNNASLVFILHGSGGNGRDMMNNTKKLTEKANHENAILVYPNGYKKYWNECRKAANSPANIENIDDNAFFSAMIDYFKKNHHINEKQVFAVGTSGGGHMAYKLALTMPHKFRAITAIIANLPDTDNLDCAEAKVPVPVMIINGTEDKINPYLGGTVISGNVNFGKVRATDSTFGYWATLAGYKGTAKKESLPDTDPADGKTIERFRYKKKGKPEIVLLKVIGGKHDYPNDIDVHVEAWEFFKRQRKL